MSLHACMRACILSVCINHEAELANIMTRAWMISLHHITVYEVRCTFRVPHDHIPGLAHP